MKRVTDWFQENKRELPFRKDPTPYSIWISEIMLQQTRIETVRPYYERFLKRLPDISSLAEIEEDELMKLWQGLGYYSRARNLKKAAVMIMNRYGGVFPETASELKKLPGIGSYTAAAIASMAFHEAVPVVDGNVLRVVSRFTGSYDDVMLEETKKKTESFLQAYIDREAPDISLFNQGMMELGETLCLPNTQPLCSSCPLKEDCEAFQKGLTGQLPVRIPKVKKRREKLTVLILRKGEKTAVVRRPEKGLLSGLYGYPLMEGFRTEEEICEYLTSLGLRTLKLERLPEKKHIFTHIVWQMQGILAEVEEEKEISSALIFAAPEEIRDQYALPSAFLKWDIVPGDKK